MERVQTQLVSSRAVSGDLFVDLFVNYFFQISVDWLRGVSISSFNLPNPLIAARRWVLAFLGDKRDGLKIDPPLSLFG